MLIDELFGRMPAGDVATDSREVFGGDAEMVGIERNLAMGEAILVNERDELLEELILTVAPFHIAAREVAVHLVIHIEQEALQVVAGYLIAERVFAIGIDGGGSSQQSVNGGGVIIGQRKARFLFDEMKESRLHAQAGFAKHIAVCGKVRDAEVIASSFEAEHGAGQEDELRVAHHFVLAKIDKNLPPAVAAEDDDDAVELVEPAVKSRHIAGSSHKRAFSGEGERVFIFHKIFLNSPANVEIIMNFTLLCSENEQNCEQYEKFPSAESPYLCPRQKYVAWRTSLGKSTFKHEIVF